MAKSKEMVVVGKSPISDFSENAGTTDVTQITDIGDLVGFDLSADLPANVLIEKAAQAVAVVDRLHVGAGLCLIKAKSMLPHGEFVSHLKQSGIPKQRASEMMRLCESLIECSLEDRKKLLQQPKVVLLGLSRMDDEVRQQWLDTGELDDVLTLNEYKAKLAKKDKSEALLQQENEQLSLKIKRMEAQADLKVDAITPVTVVHLRKAAAGFGQEAIALLRAFEDLRSRALELRGSPIANWVQPMALQFIAMQQMVIQAAQDELALTLEAFGLEDEKLSATAVSNAIPMVEETQLIREHLNGIMVGAEMRRDDVRKLYSNAIKDANDERGARYKTSSEKTAKKARG